MSGIAGNLVRWIYTGLDWAGVAAILTGLLIAVAHASAALRRGQAHVAYVRVRTTFGRSILLGLELFVAADIVRTMAFQPTLENLAVLAVLIAIRTFLSWALEVEIDGRWPWRRPVESMQTAGVDS